MQEDDYEEDMYDDEMMEGEEDFAIGLDKKTYLAFRRAQVAFLGIAVGEAVRIGLEAFRYR